MKRKPIVTVLTIALTSVLTTGCTSASATEKSSSSDSSKGKTKIVLATTTGYKPFVYTDENNKLVGYDIELVKAVFKRLPQYDLEITQTAWDSVLTGLDSGIYQISSECIFYSKERAEKYNYSEPIAYDPGVAVHAKGTPKVTTMDDLAGKTIPGSSGNMFTQAAENYNKDHPDKPINIEYQNSDFFQIFSKAAQGKWYLTTDYAMASSMQNENKFDVEVDYLDRKALSKYMDSSYTYFLLSKYKGNEKLLDDVNGALKEVMKDGTAKKISEKYFKGKDFTPIAGGYTYK